MSQEHDPIAAFTNYLDERIDKKEAERRDSSDHIRALLKTEILELHVVRSAFKDIFRLR